jgi:hypothetical protein
MCAEGVQLGPPGGVRRLCTCLGGVALSASQWELHTWEQWAQGLRLMPSWLYQASDRTA